VNDRELPVRVGSRQKRINNQSQAEDACFLIKARTCGDGS
jgi:hypothetical protein